MKQITNKQKLNKQIIAVIMTIIFIIFITIISIGCIEQKQQELVI